MTLYIKVIISIILLSVLVSCDDTKRKKTVAKNSEQVLSEQKLRQNNQPVRVKPIVMTAQRTKLIGDAAHPTIDGGIINAADGIPVNEIKEDLIIDNQQSPDGEKIAKNVLSKDSWATSEKVRKMLQEAAADGKLDYVLHKTEEKGLPASIATIPMVESNYKNDVVSAKGAVGAWQLMPQTAQDAGLNSDESRKFVPATDAAVNLLAQLHEQFGNWEFAFAAYNAGSERVKAALQKNPGAQSVNDLDLPQETKDYVAKIMAINQTLETL